MSYFDYQRERSRRLNLKPYDGQRLAFEGVLNQITPLYFKNQTMISLNFVSLKAIDRDLYIDHANILVSEKQFNHKPLERFKVYHFSAKIQPYVNTRIHPKIQEKTNYKNYGLNNINWQKIKKLNKLSSDKPTLYQENQIMALINKQANQYLEKNWIENILNHPNNGSREKLLTYCANILIERKMYPCPPPKINSPNL